MDAHGIIKVGVSLFDRFTCGDVASVPLSLKSSL